jgi:hypothetical protein
LLRIRRLGARRGVVHAPGVMIGAD